MRHHLERIRQKPHHEKKRFAFFFSLSVTAVITLVWLSTMRIHPILGEEVAAPKSPFEAVSENLGSAFNSFRKGTSAIGDYTKGEFRIEASGDNYVSTTTLIHN